MEQPEKALRRGHYKLGVGAKENLSKRAENGGGGPTSVFGEEIAEKGNILGRRGNKSS